MAKRGKKKLIVQLPAKVRRKISTSKKLHRIIYGGRSKGATWSIARIILLKCMQYPHYVLCVRQTKDSIEKSVYRTLKITIERLKLGGFFDVQRTRILGRNGSEIVFAGLDTQTQDSIKSLESATICWVSEAQSLKKDAIDILIPTIRGTPEKLPVYYWDFNPGDAFDPAYFMFILNKRRDTELCFMTYRDNPWLPVTQLSNIREAYRLDRTNADHVWGGKLKPQGTDIWFNLEVVTASMNRKVDYFSDDPIVIGADIARRGGDKIIFYKRKGFQVIDEFKGRYLRTPDTVRELIKFTGEKDAIINIDHGNIGAAVADYVEDEGFNINRINFGGSPVDDIHYGNKITELYHELSENLPRMGIPFDEEIAMQLCTRRLEYGKGNKGEEQARLESKEVWQKRQHKTNSSPDEADGLVLCGHDPEVDDDMSHHLENAVY